MNLFYYYYLEMLTHLFLFVCLQKELDDVPRGPEIFSSRLLEIEQLNKIKQEIDQVGKHDILYLASVYIMCSYS